MRYIDVDQIRITAETSHCSGDTLVLLSDVRRALAQTPTADVVEVKYGAWVNGRYNDWKSNMYEEQCSICGIYSVEYGHPFCPHCGAKMDAEGSIQ